MDSKYKELQDVNKKLLSRIEFLEKKIEFISKPGNTVNDLLKKIIHLKNSAVFVIEQEKITDANINFANLLGYSTNELIGKNWQELLDKHVESSINLNSDCPDKFVRFIKKDSTILDTEIHFCSAQSAGDHLQYIVVNKNLSPSNEFSQCCSRFPHLEVINNIPFMLWIKNKAGKYIVANNSFLYFCNLDLVNLVGKNDEEIWPSELAKKLIQYDQEAIETKRQKVVIESFSGSIADPRWFDTFISPIQNENGEVIGTTGFARDISQRVSLFSELKESEEKYQLIAENQTDFIIKTNKNGELEFASPSLCELFGKKEHDLLGRKLNPYIHEEDLKRSEETIKKLHVPPFSCYVEQRAQTKKGWRWIGWSDKAVYDKNDNFLGFIGTGRDITNLKEAESLLLQPQNNEDSLLVNLPFMTWVKDLQGKFLFANKYFADFNQSSPDYIVGKTNYDLHTSDLADRYVAVDNEVIRSAKQVITEEFTLINNEFRWFQSIKNPLYNHQREIIGTCGIAVDITDKKLSEERLKKSEDRYKNLITLMPETIFECNKEGLLTFFNLQGLKIFEYSETEIKSLNLSRLIYQGDRERLDYDLKKALEGFEIKGVEYRAISHSGKIFSILLYINHIYCDKEIIGFRGVITDITKQKIAEQNEQKYADNLFFLSNTALDFLSIPNDNLFEYIGQKLNELGNSSFVIISKYEETDDKFKIKYLSPLSPAISNKLEKILKHSLDGLELSISDKYKRELCTYTHLKQFDNGLYQLCDQQFPGRICRRIEKILNIRKVLGIALMQEGKLFGTASLLTFNGDEFINNRIIETFIYEASVAVHRKYIENELIKAKEEAEDSDKLKSAFLANMSHEIRTPMNGILGMAQLIDAPDTTPDLREEYIKIIDNCGNSLVSLVDNLIDLSKLESKQLKLLPENFTVLPLMQELFEYYQNIIQNKGKEIVLSLNVESADRQLSIFTDRLRLKQILKNLLDNSVKFTERGEIKFGYSLTRDDYISFYVKDSGIGFPEEMKIKLFKAFTQEDNSLTRRYGGSGLGLPIAQGLVNLMNGKMFSSSLVHEGSEFTFSIPRITNMGDIKETKPDIAKSANTIDWSNHLILITEDDLIGFKLLQGILRRTQIQIIRATDGMMAVETCKNNDKIELVLMDIQLPGIDGYEATREIKKFRPNLPIIAQTANAMEEDRWKCYNAGCDDFVSKPINFDKLLNTIAKYLDK
ncbi:MAG: PAS domain S-box protein [Bacteroidota bacterium]|nr:PAS domain S-box protein [Bacteroidota bacterium]